METAEPKSCDFCDNKGVKRFELYAFNFTCENHYYLSNIFQVKLYLWQQNNSLNLPPFLRKCASCNKPLSDKYLMNYSARNYNVVCKKHLEERDKFVINCKQIPPLN